MFEELLDEVRVRVNSDVGVLDNNCPRVYWVNPVADIMAMNIFEDSGYPVILNERLVKH